MKKKIAVVAGGDSGESVISVNSAKTIMANMDTERFEPYLIVMYGKDWHYDDPNFGKVLVDRNDFSILTSSRKIVFDAVYIIIHGTPGEDGILQGYFELIGIPYTTCDSHVSSLTFNKRFTKAVIRELGIHTANSVNISKNTEFYIDEISELLNLPVFVKPNAGGSSIGMSRIKDYSDLDEAINRAFQEDSEVLLEEFIQGTEVTCGLMETKGNMLVFPLTEVVSKKEFFDYEAKYTSGMSEEITPARIPEDLATECKRLSVLIYKKLNCKGIVRIDYILKDNEFFFLEVNTVPGMSAASIVPQMAKVHGLTLKDLISMQLEEII